MQTSDDAKTVAGGESKGSDWLSFLRTVQSGGWVAPFTAGYLPDPEQPVIHFGGLCRRALELGFEQGKLKQAVDTMTLVLRRLQEEREKRQDMTLCPDCVRRTNELLAEIAAGDACGLFHISGLPLSLAFSCAEDIIQPAFDKLQESGAVAVA